MESGFQPILILPSSSARKMMLNISFLYILGVNSGGSDDLIFLPTDHIPRTIVVYTPQFETSSCDCNGPGAREKCQIVLSSSR